MPRTATRGGIPTMPDSANHTPQAQVIKRNRIR